MGAYEYGGPDWVAGCSITTHRSEASRRSGAAGPPTSLLDIPSAESDWYFKQLSNQSFYNTQRGDKGGTQLTVNINGNEVHKNWDQVPELNALAQRIRRDGQLAAYQRPGVLAGTSDRQTISSTRAYAEVLRQSGGNPSPSPAVASAFAMAPPAAVSPALPEAQPAVVAREPTVSR